MREILFRGKSVNDKGWVEGSLRITTIQPADDTPFKHYEIEDTTIGVFSNDFMSGVCETVDPETVGQFTGMTDKNGKKIFEGDICRTAVCDMTVQKDFGIVCYDSMGMLSLKRVDGVYSDFFFHINIGCVEVYSIEVIGNIHDNPELLEVSEDVD